MVRVNNMGLTEKEAEKRLDKWFDKYQHSSLGYNAKRDLRILFEDIFKTKE